MSVAYARPAKDERATVRRMKYSKYLTAGHVYMSNSHTYAMHR